MLNFYFSFVGVNITLYFSFTWLIYWGESLSIPLRWTQTFSKGQLNLLFWNFVKTNIDYALHSRLWGGNSSNSHVKHRKIVLKKSTKILKKTLTVLSLFLQSSRWKTREKLLKIESKMYETLKTVYFKRSQMAVSEWVQINYQPQYLELIELTSVFVLIIWAFAIHAEKIISYSKHDQVSDSLQQLELDAELESVFTSPSRATSSQLILMQQKCFQLLLLLNYSNNSVVINWKMHGSLKEKSIFKMLWLTQGMSEKKALSSDILHVIFALNMLLFWKFRTCLLIFVLWNVSCQKWTVDSQVTPKRLLLTK